jgi:hypothetical protein
MRKDPEIKGERSPSLSQTLVALPMLIRQPINRPYPRYKIETELFRIKQTFSNRS